MVNININGRNIEALEGQTVLEAARAASIEIPTLCFLKDMNETSSCRVCMVEVKGIRNLQASCTLKVREGMEILTNSPRVQNALRINTQLLIANHKVDCLHCRRNKNCELQDLAERVGIEDLHVKGDKREAFLDMSSPALVRDSAKCILCGRCVSTCKEKVGIGALGFKNRGFQTQVSTSFDIDIGNTSCISCGQCIISCPVGALREKSDVEKVWDALGDPTKHVIVQTAPAVRAGLGEEFGMPMGTKVTGKMVTALKNLGFEEVFDTNFAADLTIMEEAHELLDRLNNNGILPMITSCSPGWINFVEKHHPHIIPHLSTCKSPHQMFGAILKSYHAEKIGKNPQDIYVVSVMPCIAKKGEAERKQMITKGVRDVDSVITTRELAHMIKKYGMDFQKLPESSFDQPLGEYSGAGVIFGATGGVMEAALRTANDVLHGKEIESIDYHDLRGIKDIKESALKVGDLELKVAVAHGVKQAKKLIKDIAEGNSPYHFIEIMGCSGGCVTGGGQPIKKAKIHMEYDVRKERAKALYQEDIESENRKSHKNELVQKLYDEFLGKPNSHLAHELLHTHYESQHSYQK